MIAPVHGPKVYPDNVMSVEYRGIGAANPNMVNYYVTKTRDDARNVVIKMRMKRVA